MPLKRNIRLTLAYDGANYCGWQVQANGPSLQAYAKVHSARGPTDTRNRSAPDATIARTSTFSWPPASA